MERKELFSKFYEVVNKKFDEFKTKLIDYCIDDYCEEMALMYNFKKYLQYIEEENRDFSNTELKYVIEQGLDLFIDTFMEMFWNSDLGNSYADIKTLMEESIKEIFNNSENIIKVEK